MSRPARWWRPDPRPNRRPGSRSLASRKRWARYTADDVADGFELGYRCGQGDAGKRDDLLDVADAAGVTPLDDRAEQVADEVERWLREQD